MTDKELESITLKDIKRGCELLKEIFVGLLEIPLIPYYIIRDDRERRQEEKFFLRLQSFIWNDSRYFNCPIGKSKYKN